MKNLVKSLRVIAIPIMAILLFACEDEFIPIQEDLSNAPTQKNLLKKVKVVVNYSAEIVPGGYEGDGDHVLTTNIPAVVTSKDFGLVWENTLGAISVIPEHADYSIPLDGLTGFVVRSKAGELRELTLWTHDSDGNLYSTGPIVAANFISPPGESFTWEVNREGIEVWRMKRGNKKEVFIGTISIGSIVYTKI